MPHFKTAQLKLPNLPSKVTHSLGEFCFMQVFHSTQNPHFSLLQVYFIPKDSKEKIKKFFLEIKTRLKAPHKTKETIVHLDKNSRISPIEIIKSALKILMDFQDSILSHNLNGKSQALECKLPFIREIEDFLDFENLLKTFARESQVSKNTNFLPKVWLEIGFGSGRYLLHNAKNYPEILHIGLEIHSPSLEQVARQIGLLGLKNILILSYDARIFLEILPSNTLDKIFVHFPVPWDKQPHRRILSHTFLTQSARVLKEKGHLQLRTDSLDYFNYAKNLAQDFKTDFQIQSHVNAEEAIISKYEARWLRQNKDIYTLEFLALHSSTSRKLDFDFAFLDSAVQPLLFLPKNFQRTKIVQKDYFLHLEDLFISPYDSSSPPCLLKISFGDFNYPQTRYALQTNHLEYFKENPLPTYLNYKAHQQLLQLIQNDFSLYKES
ncbi:MULTISPECIES: tRNA (guanosine(46)-N7)-methyltransferase TrmB [Helicobacter]|uniref:tRNA (guanine-N(7)-)-methyltransferase n=3 Tax=Helicobacteraceae TaxID=72293 RepID=A0A3D8IGZ8_9HELI|nr:MULTISPECIES: tRNA (guanosine(46)-N7)-methyltransferase TrmB [Helicobacter]RDU64398.1 tRNA (guanosine(46)-N7)-methyltransferase TrmB [Helicobacter ganmani]